MSLHRISNPLAEELLLQSKSVTVLTGDGSILARDNVVAMNKAVSGNTTLLLPSVHTRQDRSPLYITDFNGNAQNITLTPFGTETVLGLSSWIIYPQFADVGRAFQVLINVAELNGWLVIG